MQNPPSTRFAPSPTGYLHLGHVVYAIYVWGMARARSGRVLLRIEDHDRVRSRPLFEAAIVEDLAWLGFEPDAGLAPLHRQSDHEHTYEAALARLRETHHVYACACSRRELGGGRYDGRCRARGIEERPGVGIRVRLDDAPERFEDLLLGPLEQVPAQQSGDLLVKDRDGNWTYQFAVTVDDLLHDIDLVIRGEDLVSSTGRQMKLARMLGRAEPPRFAHHPLVLKESGEKLSKASGDSGVRELRAAGAGPAEVLGRAAFAAGLVPAPVSLKAADVADLFR